ncbi:alpha/beta hydrolase [Microbacterium sp. NPDC091313]
MYGLEEEAFAAESVPAEVAGFTAAFAAMAAGRPSVWQIGVAEARAGGFMPSSPVSERAYDIAIEGGPSLHVVPHPAPRGVLLHVHGGGFILGGADKQDALLEHIADTVGVTVVSVEYRLAPEHPYPAAWDDCDAAAQWLVDNAVAELGAPLVLMAGSSAGALLAVATLVRLRDRGLSAGIRGIALDCGVYDSTMTPSQRQASAGMLTADDIARNRDAYAPDEAIRREPDVSPLYADLRGMPPALFTVGTLDAMLDDSLFMYGRWLAAGARAELALYPGADHAFTDSPHPSAPAAIAHIDEFLAACLPRT